MFLYKRKLDLNVRTAIDNRPNDKFRVLIKYKKFQENIIKKISSYSGDFINKIDNCNIVTAMLNARGIKRIIEYPEVESVSFDEYLFVCGTSVLTANKLRLNTHNELSGCGVTVAIIDTGIYPHGDLTTPTNRIVKFVDLINGFNFPYDDNGHGTAVAGVIAGNGSKSSNLYRGVAKDASLISYKAFDQTGKGYISDILFSMESIINEKNETNVKIICMPFETLNSNIFIENLFCKIASIAKDNNILCILPSGSNKNLDGSIKGIALSTDCLTVSGYDSSKNSNCYTYSSVGSAKKSVKPNISAACVDVVTLNSNITYVSEKNGNKLYPPPLLTSYKSYTGTSIACAYIAGICALLYEINKDLTITDIFSLIELACDELDSPKHHQGFGKFNLNKIKK